MKPQDRKGKEIVMWIPHKMIEWDEKLFWNVVFRLPNREEAAKMTGLQCNCKSSCAYHRMEIDHSLSDFVANPWPHIPPEEFLIAFNQHQGWVEAILQGTPDEAEDIGWEATPYLWKERKALLEKWVEPFFLTEEELEQRHIRIAPGFYPKGADPSAQWDIFISCLKEGLKCDIYQRPSKTKRHKPSWKLLTPKRVVGFKCPCCGKKKVAT